MELLTTRKMLGREVRKLLKLANNHLARSDKDLLERRVLGEDINNEEFIDIICGFIKRRDVELSILSLQILKRHIESQDVSSRSLQAVADTVTKIEFTSIESDLVEEGFLQAVRVCTSMAKCRASHELTNGSISEIIIFCFRVVNSKLVKWLRSKAARALLSITKIVFRRLPQFPEDKTLMPSYQIRLRLGGASSQSTFKEMADQSSATKDNSSTSSPTSIITSNSIRIINERNQPYNLAFINDFFCYLASLINPHETESNKVNEDKIMLGLLLLRTAFTEAWWEIGQKSSLINITRNNICYNIVSIMKSTLAYPIVTGALNLATDIFIDLRYHLKYQFEAFLERLMEMLASTLEHSTENHFTNATLELKSDVLFSVLELLKNIEHFPHELYYNYDCDPHSSNIYENLVQICSKNCFQHSLENHFTPIQLTSFKCLLTNLADIHKIETGENEYFVLGVDPFASDLNESGDVATKISNRFPSSFKDLNEAKKRKRLLWLALEKFNARPKDGIAFIKENMLIDNNNDLVQLLKDNLRVDKKTLGEFLSKEENKPLRIAFIDSLDFTNLRIDEALRFMLEKFRIPGESQLIERILDAFALHWFDQNPGILQNSDCALSLAYAIIMLNVDQHSKKVKPMTCDEFDRNLLGPKRERIYERTLLDQIYTNIRDNEIVLPDEQVGATRQRYLWKCTLVRSDRVDSLYWIASRTSIKDPQRAPSLDLIDMNKILFEIMWSPTVAALSFIFDKIDTSIYEDLSKEIVNHGFIKFALLCAHYGHLDNLVVSLCKFTTDLSPVPHHNLMSDKNSLAALSLLSIIKEYANSMRDSWSNIVKNILQWYCSKCIDDIVQVDDFALQRKLRLRMREVKKSPSTMNQQSSTFLRSVYTYFAGSNEGGNASGPSSISDNNNHVITNGADTRGNGHVDENNVGAAAAAAAPSAIQELIQTIQEAEYCQESLVELITALTTTSLDGDTEEVEDAEVFKLEIFTQVILNNRDQASKVWPRIRAYFARQSSLCGRSSWLGERLISAAFRVAIQFHPKPEVFSLLNHIIVTLDAEIVRGDYTFVALMTLTELHTTNATMDAKELEACFNQVIFPFLDKVLDGCDPIQVERTLKRAINLLNKIFLKHREILKELQTFALLWYAILDTMEKYIKANNKLKEQTFELVKNMVLVMDNDQCMSVEMKDITRTKFMFWEFQSGSDY